MSSLTTTTVPSPDFSLLETFAAEVSTAAQTLTSFLKTQPSHNDFLPGGGSFDIPPSAPADISVAKAQLLEKTMRLQQLVMSATDMQQQMTLTTQHMAAVRWIVRFKVADYVPAPTGSAVVVGTTYDECASKANVPVEILKRVVRMAMTAGVFREIESADGAGKKVKMLAHTKTSLDLRSSCAVSETFKFLTETGHTVVGKLVEMTEATVAKGKPVTAFSIAMNTEMPFFKYIMSNPELAKQQAAHMNSVGAAEESHVRHVLSGYNWGGLRAGAKVIDVGGSTGHCCVALAREFPGLQFVVQDLQPVLAQAKIPADLQDRVTLQAHDFLTPQPETSRNADVFFIRQCLQNWNRENAVRILKNLVSAMDRARSSRIVIMSVVLADAGDEMIGQREKGISRMRDLFMMQAMGAQERDLAQWEELIADVDAGLVIVGVEKPKGSVLSVIEVNFQEGV